MPQLNRRVFLLNGLVLGIELPSALALAAEPPSPLAVALRDDPRLARPVTLRRKRNPISDVLADLRRQTEASIEPAAEVADEPAIVFVKGTGRSDGGGAVPASGGAPFRVLPAAGE